ncbi:MAG: RimK family alpha-L-glutamate ligase [Anaeromyxobacteraceae bacterium]|nr:RimK family alpha-L-glutamate ligase [Anaeromyxobacteraceae bacterium]
MRLTVLSRSPRLHTTRRLLEAARALGHEATAVDPLEVELGLGGAAPAVTWRRRRFPATDVVIPRIGPSIHQYGLSVVKQLELLGVPLLNGAAAIAASRNKMRCLQLLAAAGVPVPRTVMASDPSGLEALVKLVGGVPVLVKLLSPDGKSGVMVCESLQSLEAALEAILGLGQNIMVQQYLAGGRGRELRALVVGGRVVAALRRQRKAGRGARFLAAELSPEQARVAAAAARVLDLQVCAVDMLDVKGGPRVFEVNGAPSVKEAEAACGVDVARLVVEAALAMVGRR